MADIYTELQSELSKAGSSKQTPKPKRSHRPRLQHSRLFLPIINTRLDYFSALLCTQPSTLGVSQWVRDSDEVLTIL